VHIESVGAFLFGVVAGWITYRTLRRDHSGTSVSDIATVLAAIGGGAVTALFPDAKLFGWYSVGLFVGFFGYLILGHTVMKNSRWMGMG
jgi:hypothetical protein